MSEFGALSLLPPLLAIVLALVTRKAVLSLFLGIWSGGVLYAGGPNPLADPWGWIEGVVASGFGIVPTFDWVVAAIIADDGFHAQILVFTLLLGSGVAMIWNLGGSYAVRNWALSRLETQREAGAVTWLLGLLLFFDDYANTAIVGSTMKDVSDQLLISREKLSYIVDSTAAPVATLGISSWVAFQLGLIRDAYDDLGLQDHPSAFEIFISSIPFNMYAILAIVMVAIIVGTRRDYGEMLDAEHRSLRTGKVYREDAQPMQDVEADLGDPEATNPRLLSFFVPVVVLIVVTIGSALLTGYDPGDGLYDMVIDADYATALIYGSFAMVLSGFVIGKVYDIFGFNEATDTTIDGFGLMLTAVSILVLAWGIGEVVAALDTGAYVAEYVGEHLPPSVLPAVILVTAAFIAFSTGTSWGTMAILTPIAIPVAWQLTGDHTMVAAVVGTIFSGAIFGDHTSPISDTSVLSSTFTGADLIDHVRTQFYYAGTVGIVAITLLLVWGITAISPLVLLSIGAIVLVVLVYALSELDARRKGVDPIAASVEQKHQGEPVKPASGSDDGAEAAFGGQEPTASAGPDEPTERTE
ncbi:Na+/H+ antiporter NhaC family protein [Natronobacterium gregoryi]|uniref:Na+/H+ antiporter n=2 Tax=Natronobacterium gregoryi TaxID=44930 RepID=L0AJA6_NATGS|nr:Na+/H+ antiporter NhaC family protein [Natronobacterium gregoryi]AFZ73891.1 Na+/H+ antiporter [Natronobacterium gregoryi SP2]ELY64847.1 Na+/H+ antiporter NhaC [Natronobacterium gregoryi SP2]PLK19151.1 sodium:proton antiporter [Natronobacterium gregoryi SP2]SFJ59568.1 transporter, NhaC family [Natronobacterium gregoryi]